MVCKERPVTVEMQRFLKAAGGRARPRKKNSGTPQEILNTHLSYLGKKKFRAELEEELPKGKHDVPQWTGFPELSQIHNL